MTVRGRVADPWLAFTRSELKAVRELWSNHLAAGLILVSRLAWPVGVSDSTMVRPTERPRYQDLIELQEALFAEIEGHLGYPLATLASQRRDFESDNAQCNYLDGVIAALHVVVSANMDAAAALLSDGKPRIRCLGGRERGHA